MLCLILIKTYKHILYYFFKKSNIWELVLNDYYYNYYILFILFTIKKFFVIKSLTGYKFPIECNIYEEEPKEKTTKFKETGKLWCNTIQNYLENEFGFKGLTKLKIFGHAGYLETFNISISGKGTNDFLVKTMGFISDMVSTSKIHYYSDYMFV